MSILCVLYIVNRLWKAALITVCFAFLSITINSQTPVLGCDSGKIIESSSFNNDAEGWTLAGDGENLRALNGYITGDDQGEGVGWYFKAPGKFLGDMSRAYGGSISFELNQIKNGNPEFQWSLVRIDDGETFLWYNPDPNPKATGWTRLTVCFKESKGWGVWKGEKYVREATRKDLKKVLSNLNQLLILPEHSSDRDVGGLRNVAMYEGIHQECTESAVTLKEKIGLETDIQLYAPEESVIVHYDGLRGFADDWITIVKASTLADEYAEYQYTKDENGDSKKDGSMAFVEKLQPGQFEVRLYYDPDGGCGSFGKYEIIARHEFTVTRLYFLREFNDSQIFSYRDALLEQVRAWNIRARDELVYGNLNGLAIDRAQTILELSKTGSSRDKTIDSILEAYEKLGKLKDVAALRTLLISQYLKIIEKIPAIGDTAAKLLEAAADNSEEVEQNKKAIEKLFKVKPAELEQKQFQEAKNAMDKAEELIRKRILDNAP